MSQPSTLYKVCFALFMVLIAPITLFGFLKALELYGRYTKFVAELIFG